MRVTSTQQSSGFVPPYILQKIEGSAASHNGGIVPPAKGGSVRPDLGKNTTTGTAGTNGNGGIVPPYKRPGSVSDKVGGRANPPRTTGSNTGIVPPYLQPKPPLAPSGNTGIVPPYLQSKKLPNLTGADCFPHVPTRMDPSGVEVVEMGVKDTSKPGALQQWAGRKTLAN
jgi:hypothetical protein